MMYLLIIATFMAVLVRDGAPTPPLFAALGPMHAAALTLLAHACIIGVVHLICRAAASRLETPRGPRGFLRAERWLTWSRFLIVTWHVAAVLAFGWLDAVRTIIPEGVGLDELVATLPPLAAIALGWWSWHPLEDWARSQELIVELDAGRPVYHPPKRLEFVLGAVRHHMAIVVIPIAAITVWAEIVQSAAAALQHGRPARAIEWIAPLALATQIVGVAAVFGLMPPVMRRIWDTIALPPGDLRDDLINLCRRHRIAVRELLVWRTHGTMTNAAVLGFIAPLRYILLSDTLLDRLPEPQVQAVMTHEIAHVRLHHMAWLAASLIASIILAGVAAWWIVEFFGETWRGAIIGQYADAAAPIASLAAALVAFGFVSRCFERQADAYAAKHVGDPAGAVTHVAVETMVAALVSVSAANRMRLDRWTWRHGSIAQRIDHLRTLKDLPVRALPIDRQARGIKIIAALGLAIGILLAVLTST